MTERTLFDAVDELAFATDSHSIALCACSCRHVAKVGETRAYARELYNLARAIGVELDHWASTALQAARTDGVELATCFEHDGPELRLFAEVLALIGPELRLFAEVLALIGAELTRLAAPPEGAPAAPAETGTVCACCGLEKAAGAPCAVCKTPPEPAGQEGGAF